MEAGGDGDDRGERDKRGPDARARATQEPDQAERADGGGLRGHGNEVVVVFPVRAPEDLDRDRDGYGEADPEARAECPRRCDDPDRKEHDDEVTDGEVAEGVADPREEARIEAIGDGRVVVEIPVRAGRCEEPHRCARRFDRVAVPKPCE